MGFCLCPKRANVIYCKKTNGSPKGAPTNLLKGEVMPLLYIARQKSNNKKNGAISNFDRSVALTCRNLALYALGKFGVAQTGIRFKGGIRRQENFESAGVLQFDIDLADHNASLSSSEWRAWIENIFDSFPYKVFAYASQHRGAHVFVVLKEEIKDLAQYLSVTRKMISYMSSLIDSSFAHVDLAVKDGARMFFEGFECDDPENWVYENGGAPLDPERLPQIPPSPSYAAPLDLVSEGNRNNSAYKIAHKCLDMAGGDERKAGRLFQIMTEGSTLPKGELGACFESACKKRSFESYEPQGAGASLKNPRTAAKAEAYEEIGRKLNGEFRKDRGTAAGEVNSLYLLRPLEGENCGIAQKCSREAYLDRRTDLCRNPEYSATLQQAMLRGASVNFPVHILSDEGLVKRKPGKAIFKNGAFCVSSGFKPLGDREWLVDPLDFDYTEEECSGPFKKFLDSVLPPYPDVNISPEQLLLKDFVRSSLLGDRQNEQFLICVGRGSNGKSTLAEIISNTLGKEHVALPSKDLLSKDRPRFALGQAREGYLGIMHELGNKSVLSNEGTKNFISKDDKSSDVKNAREALRFSIPYNTMALTNYLPVFEDMSDTGLTRKLRVIEFRRRFDGSRRINTSDPELLKDCARWICECLRAEPVEEFVWENYPARKEWLKDETDKGVLGELLKPAGGRRVVKISQIMLILSKTHNPLAKLGNKKLIRLMESWGYQVARTTHGCELKGYEIDAQSPMYKCANGERLPLSYEDDGQIEEAEKEKEERKEGYKGALDRGAFAKVPSQKARKKRERIFQEHSPSSQPQEGAGKETGEWKPLRAQPAPTAGAPSENPPSPSAFRTALPKPRASRGGAPRVDLKHPDEKGGTRPQPSEVGENPGRKALPKKLSIRGSQA